MSIEAIAFAKSMELGESESPAARLLLYVIAENTFNDSGLCRVGQQELRYQTRLPLRTLQRQYRILSGGCRDHPRKKFIDVKARGARNGRQPDEISIVGFIAWLKDQRVSKPQRGDAVTGRVHEQPAKMASSQNGGKRNPPKHQHLSTSNPPMVAGIYKDNRTSNRTSEDARSNAHEDSISDLEVKTVRQRLRRELGAEVFEAWFPEVAFVHDGADVSVETSVKAVRNWIRDRYEATILRVCQSQWPDVRHIKFKLVAAPMIGVSPHPDACALSNFQGAH